MNNNNNHGKAIGRVTKIDCVFAKPEGYTKLNFILETDRFVKYPDESEKVLLPVTALFKSNNKTMASCNNIRVGDYIECSFSVGDHKNLDGTVAKYHVLYMREFRFLTAEEQKTYVKKPVENNGMVFGVLAKPVKFVTKPNGCRYADFVVAVRIYGKKDSNGNLRSYFLCFRKFFNGDESDKIVEKLLRSLTVGTCIEVDFHAIPYYRDEDTEIQVGLTAYRVRLYKNETVGNCNDSPKTT